MIFFLMILFSCSKIDFKYREKPSVAGQVRRREERDQNPFPSLRSLTLDVVLADIDNVSSREHLLKKLNSIKGDAIRQIFRHILIILDFSGKNLIFYTNRSTKVSSEEMLSIILNSKHIKTFIQTKASKNKLTTSEDIKIFNYICIIADSKIFQNWFYREKNERSMLFTNSSLDTLTIMLKEVNICIKEAKIEGIKNIYIEAKKEILLEIVNKGGEKIIEKDMISEISKLCYKYLSSDDHRRNEKEIKRFIKSFEQILQMDIFDEVVHESIEDCFYKFANSQKELELKHIDRFNKLIHILEFQCEKYPNFKYIDDEKLDEAINSIFNNISKDILEKWMLEKNDELKKMLDSETTISNTLMAFLGKIDYFLSQEDKLKVPDDKIIDIKKYIFNQLSEKGCTNKIRRYLKQKLSALFVSYLHNGTSYKFDEIVKYMDSFERFVIYVDINYAIKRSCSFFPGSGFNIIGESNRLINYLKEKGYEISVDSIKDVQLLEQYYSSEEDIAITEEDTELEESESESESEEDIAITESESESENEEETEYNKKLKRIAKELFNTGSKKKKVIE